MNVAKRTKKLKALLDVRLGPGAARLSNDVKRIDLSFAHKINDGHFGARKVWRIFLPRLKYHNPAVSMTVNRHTDQGGPSTLTVFYADPETPSSRASPATLSTMDGLHTTSGKEGQDRTDIIDMKHKHESEILNRLIELTKAVPYKPNEDEMTELEEVKEDIRRSTRDRERQTRLNEIKKQEAALLEQAKGST